MSPKKRPGRFKELQRLYILSTVGIQLVVSIFIGLGFGYYLDGVLDTAPAFLFIFLLFGIGAGFLNLYRVAKEEEKKAEEKDSGEEE